MNITVKLFATLRNYGENKQEMTLDEGIAVGAIIQMLELPKNEVAIIMINGRHVKEDVILQDGDVLAFFPAVGGG